MSVRSNRYQLSDGVLELGLHPEITKLVWQHAMRQSVLFAWDAKHLAQRLVLLLRERRRRLRGHALHCGNVLLPGVCICST